jgi:hypothetical protein
VQADVLRLEIIRLTYSRSDWVAVLDVCDMLELNWTKIETVESCSIILSGIGVLVTTLEWLTLRNLFSSSEATSQLNASCVPRAGGPFLRLLIDSADSSHFLVVRLLALVLLILSPQSSLSTWHLALVVGSLFAWNMKRKIANDGADQLMTIILAAVLAGRLWQGVGDGAQEMAAMFIGAQACLAYSVAGIAKIVSPVWRSGAAVSDILTTKGFGCNWLRKVFGWSPWIALVAAWSVMMFETLFPIVAIMDPQGAMIAVMAGTLFHVCNAPIMGLNNFVWAFLATYPSVLFMSHRIHAVIHDM